MPFSIPDYQTNPRKYELFKTARIATNELGEFTCGQIVAISFVGTDFPPNQVRDEPVYRIKSASGNEYDVYASALDSFVL